MQTATLLLYYSDFSLFSTTTLVKKISGNVVTDGKRTGIG